MKMFCLALVLLAGVVPASADGLLADEARACGENPLIGALNEVVSGADAGQYMSWCWPTEPYWIGPGPSCSNWTQCTAWCEATPAPLHESCRCGLCWCAQG